MLLGVADLEAYLGQEEIDQSRAALLLTMAEQAAETIVRPLPEGAAWVVLDVAATAYSAPTGPGGAAAVGPFSGQVAPGGVFLSKRQAEALRRLANRESARAFTIDTTPVVSRWPRARQQWGERAMRSR
ncbi:hypothetical protein [Actinomycetospora cinnamomea]|uniref:Uncharacterized protein n=1 Tax=Actinomycetospora cinnamomea TaxID=663609 RepID=A0A2U1FAR1_9PSEU|nr:hypothetical protein [Actinomycetospora cinnamomea]PVZ09060.1 hypothetical protein C8D89_107224 [Actinomycetospora cinnamomea]